MIVVKKEITLQWYTSQQVIGKVNPMLMVHDVS